jgi:3-dehydroquinate synthase
VAAIRSKRRRRAPLDFGHWAAHKLEQLTSHRLRHGEAVAIGLALDCTYAWQTGELPEAAYGGSWRCSTRCGCRPTPGALRPPGTPEDPRSVLRGLADFRSISGAG